MPHGYPQCPCLVCGEAKAQGEKANVCSQKGIGVQGSPAVSTLVPLAMHISPTEISILGGLLAREDVAGKMFPGLGSEQSQISGWESSEHGGTDGE